MKKTFPILLLLFSITLSAQESIIKKFAEPRKSKQWMNPICLYPSTLRMINISNNPAFDELVNNVEKVLIYILDSATVTYKDCSYLIKEYQDANYEEYLSVQGKLNIEMTGKKDEFVGFVANEEQIVAFYMRGEVPFQKIPALIKTLQSGDILSVITDQFK